METVKQPNANLIVITENVKRFIGEIEMFLNNQSNRKIPKLQDVVTIDDYKKFYSASDNNMANIITKVMSAIHSRKAYQFGCKVDFEYNDGSALRREPCNCQHSPLSVQDKKKVRFQAEAFLKNWLNAAKNWLQQGANELQEIQEPQEKRVGIIKAAAPIVKKPKERQVKVRNNKS